MVKTAEHSSSEPGPSGKRKKSEDDGANGVASKKQRTRVRWVLCFHVDQVPEIL